MTSIAQRRPAIQTRVGGWPTTLAIFLLALAPRAIVGHFLTVDEAYHWLDRVERFRAALRAGDWAGTNLIGHPGVTTLWLGAAGSALHEWAGALGLLAAGDLDAQRALVRLPIGLVTALCVALAGALLSRLLGQRVALLAAVFMAGEPFLVAHSQLLHLDALLTSFMTLSLLAALLAAQSEHEPRWRWWALSGALGGLALLTKSPAILLLPMIGLIAVVGMLRTGSGDCPPGAFSAPRGDASGVRHLAFIVYRLALWVLTASVVWVALWPAAWVDPLGAAARVALQAEADGGSPHGWGNYFLGRAVADPGPLFYPVTVAFRLAPWTALGLVAGLILWLLALRRRSEKRLSIGPAVLPILTLFALGFMLALSLPPKKFDRYVLPIYPVLDILAASGLIRLADTLWRRFIGERALVPAGRTGVWVAVVGVLALNLALSSPYYLAYFNPLLGGGPVAARVVPVGWGEGYELAGAYIAAQYNGADRPVAARYEPVLGPFVPAGAAPLAWWQIPSRVDYAVVYIDQIQREDKPETFHPLLDGQRPVHVVQINGIDYAYVYQIAPPVATALAADFGEALHLRGYTLDATQIRASGALTLTLQWETRQTPAADYMLFIHVFNERGERVGNVDVPPSDVRAPASSWQPGHSYTLVQRVPLASDLPPGDYRVAIGVYDPISFARLPLRSEPRPALPEAGADALVLDTFRLP